MPFVASSKVRALVLVSVVSVAALSASVQTADAAGDSAATAGADTHFVVIEPGVFPFYAPFKGAVADAAKAFGVSPTPLIGAPQNYDQSEENAVVNSFVAKGVKGIAIQPVDAVGANVTIKRLIGSGIDVVGYGSCDNTKSAGAEVCIEASLYKDAYDATIALIKTMHSKGNIVHLAGNLAGSVTSPRIQGVKDAVKKYPKIHLIQTIANIDTPTAAPAAIANLLAARKNEIDGVVATADNPSDAWAKAMENAHEKSIPSVLTDVDPTIVRAVEQGYATGTMAANAYADAYLSVYSLKLMSQGCKYKGPFVYNIPYVFIGKGRIGTVYPTLAAQAKKIGATWKTHWTC
jgi:ribose transport system substrate-binding protein